MRPARLPADGLGHAGCVPDFRGVSERRQRLVFGEVAELYDASRPGYPDALVDDLAAWAREGSESPRALEVGAGTGKATRQLAARGVAVLAIEPSAEMAAVARRGTAAHPGVEHVQTDFERFDPAGRLYPLVYAAQAWHWVDPATGYVRAREALALGGRLVAFWNRPAWGESELRDALIAVYARIVPDLQSDSPMHPANRDEVDVNEHWEAEIAAADGLGDPEIRSYPWALRYTAQRYADLLGTLSEIRLLDAPTRAELLDAVRAVVAAHGDELTMEMHTRTCIARAV